MMTAMARRTRSPNPPLPDDEGDDVGGRRGSVTRSRKQAKTIADHHTDGVEVGRVS
jgi:hypothetical protein